MSEQEIKENLLKIKEQIRKAEIKSGRKEGSVKLCAVSKFHPASDVISAINAGQTLFGENRVQEASEKFKEVGDYAVKNGIPLPELHIIGTLQSNKVKKAVEISSCIESVDRISLLEEIEKRAAGFEKSIEVFFEIHTGEESKSGFADESSFFEALNLVAQGKFPHVIPKGLMTMAPFTEEEALIRKSFSSLRKLLEKSNSEFPNLKLTELSMGMSGDFLYAIEEGSTLVRVGTAIFGQRDYSK